MTDTDTSTAALVARVAKNREAAKLARAIPNQGEAMGYEFAAMARAERDAVIARAEQAEAERDGLLRVVTDNHHALQRAEQAEAQVAALTARESELVGERAQIEAAMGPMIHALADMFDDYAKDSPELAAKLDEIRRVFPMPSAALSGEGGE